MNQRNVPGIDNAYLAMDTEEGVEVVWNEVMFSERKNFKLQEVGAGPGGGGQMAAQAGLNETCITTSSFNATCQRINSLNSSLSVLGLSSLDQLSSSREKSLGFVGKRKSLETVSVRLEVLLSRLSPFSAVFFPPLRKKSKQFSTTSSSWSI